MIYLYKGKDNVLINLENYVGEKKVKKSVPFVSTSFGRFEEYPFDIETINEYRSKSDAHSACLDYKKRNVIQKGFSFLSKISDAELAEFAMINTNGESLYDVILQVGTDFIDGGNAYFEGVRIAGGKPMLYSIDPKNVRIILNKTRTAVENYAIKINNMGKMILLPPYKKDDKQYRFVYHIKNTNTFSRIYGYPDWYSAITAIDIHYGIDIWIKSFLDNNARFDFLIVTAGNSLTAKDEDRLKAVLGKAKGIKNKGKGGYLSVGFDTKVQVIELNKVDHSSFFKGKDKYNTQIIQAHSVSPSSVSFSLGGNSIAGNETIGALRKDYETYIKPVQVLLEQKINNLLLLMYGKQFALQFKKMDVVSEKDQAIIDNIYLSSNVVSRSYIRRVRHPELLDSEIQDAEREAINNVENKKPFLGEHPTNYDSTENYLIERS